jgi:hypothetical protein
LLALYPASGRACAHFGADTKAIDRVQSSWNTVAQDAAPRNYAREVALLESTARFLPEIHNAFIRGCVAEGANIRIASSKAGAQYLATHPRDTAGAKVAAERAWRNFPMRHDCP